MVSPYVLCRSRASSGQSTSPVIGCGWVICRTSATDCHDCPRQAVTPVMIIVANTNSFFFLPVMMSFRLNLFPLFFQEATKVLIFGDIYVMRKLPLRKNPQTPLVLAVGDSFYDSLNMFTKGCWEVTKICILLYITALTTFFLHLFKDLNSTNWVQSYSTTAQCFCVMKWELQKNNKKWAFLDFYANRMRRNCLSLLL